MATLLEAGLQVHLFLFSICLLKDILRCLSHVVFGISVHDTWLNYAFHYLSLVFISFYCGFCCHWMISLWNLHFLVPHRVLLWLLQCTLQWLPCLRQHPYNFLQTLLYFMCHRLIILCFLCFHLEILLFPCICHSELLHFCHCFLCFIVYLGD